MPTLVFRIFKSWQVVDEEDSWSNVYEVVGGTTFTPGSQAALDVLNRLVAAERAIHLPGVQFYKGVISTWGTDGTVYNPSAFRSVPLTVAGSRGSASQAMDGNVTFYVRRSVQAGRYGRLYYRGVLTESDVETGGDLASKISPTSDLLETGTAFTAYKTQMQPLLTETLETGYMALVAQYGSVDNGLFMARPVIGLVSAGVTNNKRNHRWFNRKPKATGGA